MSVKLMLQEMQYGCVGPAMATVVDARFERWKGVAGLNW